uniref:Calcium channel flower n=1 Tax=Aceria tosichella TaxID=561515 RepID=A0A6G1SFW0_9ACAR
MMASNIATAEAGGYPEQQPQNNWWVAKYSSWLASMGAVALGFVGLLAIAFNIITFSLTSAIAGGLQVVAAAIILAVEGSSVVSFLTFAKPVGLFFEGKPLYVKTTVYGALTIIPMLLGPSGMAVMLGFIISAAITALYGMILIGRKGDIEDMRAAAEAQPKI